MVSFTHEQNIICRQTGLDSIGHEHNEFKCNLKELTTKSAWVPRSAVFGMRMPGG